MVVLARVIQGLIMLSIVIVLPGKQQTLFDKHVIAGSQALMSLNLRKKQP
jgi:hypothetical protein